MKNSYRLIKWQKIQGQGEILYQKTHKISTNVTIEKRDKSVTFISDGVKFRVIETRSLHLFFQNILFSF